MRKLSSQLKWWGIGRPPRAGVALESGSPEGRVGVFQEVIGDKGKDILGWGSHECGICQNQPEGSPDLMHGGREGEEGNRWEIRRERIWTWSWGQCALKWRTHQTSGTGNDFRQHKVLNNPTLNNKIVSFSFSLSFQKMKKGISGWCYHSFNTPLTPLPSKGREGRLQSQTRVFS